jgi:hypothetical protein
MEIQQPKSQQIYHHFFYFYLAARSQRPKGASLLVLVPFLMDHLTITLSLIKLDP